VWRECCTCGSDIGEWVRRRKETAAPAHAIDAVIDHAEAEQAHQARIAATLQFIGRCAWARSPVVKPLEHPATPWMIDPSP